MNSNGGYNGQTNGLGNGAPRTSVKNNFDFNLTQPIQLTNSIPQPNKANFGVTQPGLQKIIRSLNKPNGAAASNSNAEGTAAASGEGTQSGKSL